jgi:hypothetical protein
LRTIVVWSFATYSLIMKGPEPIGRVCTRSPDSRTAFGDTIESPPPATAFRKGAYGVSNVT